jgi:hypothetical protein
VRRAASAMVTPPAGTLGRAFGPVGPDVGFGLRSCGLTSSTL